MALKEISNRLRSAVREVDIVSRYGGEEFVILLLEIDLDQANQVAERIRRSVADVDIPTDQGEIQVTISLGAAELSGESHELNQLIHLADQALYRAKENGRNCVSTISSKSAQPLQQS